MIDSCNGVLILAEGNHSNTITEKQYLLKEESMCSLSQLGLNLGLS